MILNFHQVTPIRSDESVINTSTQSANAPSTTASATTAVLATNQSISSSLTSQCILCREICVNKNDLIQHLRNHLADDNKTYVINSTNSNVTIASGIQDPTAQATTTITVPNSLVDLLKLDNKELCA